ncbi:MAG: hypothetical protein LBU19_02145 [Treponema sp.]|nr:hypothetical protein [Treponema sp.]
MYDEKGRRNHSVDEKGKVTVYRGSYDKDVLGSVRTTRATHAEWYADRIEKLAQ